MTILNRSQTIRAGVWKTTKKFEKNPNFNQTKIKPFYRVGNHTLDKYSKNVSINKYLLEAEF